MLYALLFLPAAVAIVFVLLRTRTPRARVVAEVAPRPAEISGEVDPLASLDALLAELERTTVRIDGADQLDDGAVVALEQLAEKLEAAASSLVRVA